MAFGKGKVKIIEENRDGHKDYILDCVKVNDPMVLGKRVLQEFSKGKNLYLMLDTNFAFERDHRVIEKNIENIQAKFDEVGVIYVSRDRKIEKTPKIMGLPMKKKMVREYKVVVPVNEKVFELIDFIYPRQSFLGYILEEEVSEDRIFEIHDKIHSEQIEHVEMLEKKEMQAFTYFDNYFARIRISTEPVTDMRMIQRIVQESYEE